MSSRIQQDPQDPQDVILQKFNKKFDKNAELIEAIAQNIKKLKEDYYLEASTEPNNEQTKNFIKSFNQEYDKIDKLVNQQIKLVDNYYRELGDDVDVGCFGNSCLPSLWNGGRRPKNFTARFKKPKFKTKKNKINKSHKNGIKKKNIFL